MNGPANKNPTECMQSADDTDKGNDMMVNECNHDDIGGNDYKNGSCLAVMTSFACM